MFKETDLKDLNTYIDLIKDLPFANLFTEFRDFITSNPNFEAFPVIVLSHDFNPKRSRFLTNLGDYANYIVVTAQSEKDLYKDFNCHFYDDTNIPGLANKRKYIVSWLQEHNVNNAFFLDDDCTDFVLPYRDGKSVNAPFKISYDFLFKFWTFLVNKYNYKFSGLMNWTAFRFCDLTKGFAKHNGQCIQVVQMNLSDAKERSINYDENSGWEDFDMIIQEIVNGEGTEVLPIGYHTPAITQGISTFSNLPERCITHSSALLAKWGLSLVRLDLKKGIFNTKVNWFKIRKCIKENQPFESLIHPIHIDENVQNEIRTIMNSDLDTKEKKTKLEALLK